MCEAGAAGGTDEGDTCKAVARHLPNGVDPPGATELGGEEGGKAGEVAGGCPVLASGGGGRGLGGGTEEGVNIGGCLSVVTKDEAAHVAQGAEGAEHSGLRAAVVLADGGVGVEDACLALVIGVDSAGTLGDGATAVGPGGASEVGAPSGVNGLDVKECGGGGGGRRRGGVFGGGGEGKAKAGVRDNALAPGKPIPVLPCGVGLAWDVGGKEVGEKVAGLGGPGDAGTEDVAEDTSSDGIVTVGVGTATEDGEAKVVAMRVTEAADAGASDRDRLPSEGPDGGAFNPEIGGENLAEFEGGEGVSVRGPRRNPLRGEGVGG